MSFADARKQDLLRNVLNSSYFAERVTYRSADGVESTITACIQPANGQLTMSGPNLATKEEIDVRVACDPAASLTEADGSITVLGGVEQPRLGDTLLRAGEDAARNWMFVHVVHGNGVSWLMRFDRKRTERLGGPRGK
jgi:hypothetical protein